MWKTASMLLGAVLVLLTLGIVMLASTSSVQGESQFGDALYFVKRQALWLVLGFIGMMVTAHIPYDWWKRLAVPLAVATVLLLAAVLVPGIGTSIKGSRRWLRLGSLSFQPSELAKLGTIVLLAWWMARIQRHADELWKGMIVPLGILGVNLLLIFIEPDFGTTLLIATVGMAMMFVAGVKFSYLLVAALAGLTGFFLAVMRNAERMRRIIAFLNPEKYARHEAYQLWNAIYAFVIGGGTGVGLGQSLQKRFYLPEAHTDFIFAIIGEELGLAASLLVVVLFLAILICGIRISLHAPDGFSRLLGFGLTLMITLQAVINIAVVTGCMPTKGLPLPFISFGGSSMIISMAMIGILINIGRAGITDEDIERRAIKDRGHWF
jgi:cell division protein FtsW